MIMNFLHSNEIYILVSVAELQVILFIFQILPKYLPGNTTSTPVTLLHKGLKLNTAQQQKMHIQGTQNLQKVKIVLNLDRCYFQN